jgi:hypothetical protein
MGHSFHNAVDSKINNYMAEAEELKTLMEDKKVLWNDMLPPLNIYSIEDFEQLGRENEIKCIGGYGVTIYAKPQAEDWDPENKQRSGISNKLENDKAFFKKVYNIEMENNSKKELINRGVNVFALFRK